MDWPSEPTILEGVPARTYHADALGDVPTLSRSIAHTLITASPMHAAAEHPRLPGSVEAKASKILDAGSLHHAVILGEGEEELVVLPAQYEDFRTARAREIRDEAWAAGKSPVLAEDYEGACRTAEILRPRICQAVADVVSPEEPYGVSWVDFGRELVCLWEERTVCPHDTDGDGDCHRCRPRQGLPTRCPGIVRCRARWDLCLPSCGLLCDLKASTKSYVGRASMERFCRQLDNEESSLLMQGASYQRGLEAVHPEMAGRTSFAFIRFEIEPPYAVGAILLTQAHRQLGEDRWLSAVRGWARCLSSGQWPGPEAMVAPPPQAWAVQRSLDRMAEEGEDGDATD
jgi:hypothetical protein